MTNEKTPRENELLHIARNFISIDLEVNRDTDRIHKIAGVKADLSSVFSYTRKQGSLDIGLLKLDRFASDCPFVLGHNIVEFDLPHLRAINPNLNILKKEAIDTLRLNPLAHPKNPYHRLVKHYKDGQLVRGQINNPELDARLTIEVFTEQLEEFTKTHRTNPDLLTAWHHLITDDSTTELDHCLRIVRGADRPSSEEAREAISRLLATQGCQTYTNKLLQDDLPARWDLAYALSWLSVAGSNSVVPPWVRHQFPGTCDIIRQLRDTRCADPHCEWCLERHNPQKELKRWFGFDAFRPEPKDGSGRPLQEVIVDSAMKGKNVLGILPTGTGKSLCYQIPALSRYDKTGALTVVVSPLVALMEDQVNGLRSRGIECCAAINGMLSMPERAEILDKLRLGDIGILIISPEQLRNKTVRKVLAQREIGSWVLDEAHCLSKWGQDFRPDYRYVGRFIKERSENGRIPPVLCLTATAKPEVVDDITRYFEEKLGIKLIVFNGGATRDNLTSYVTPTTEHEKYAHVEQLLSAELPPEIVGGAIVYCSTRKKTEEIKSFLVAKGWAADCFHAGLTPENKKTVQEQFIKGQLRVIAATNAFGMGIDKPDVRLVIHADIPGSLENYLQEAGRAGRDREPAKCVLLFNQDDVERQFQMSARSRLRQDEIQSILQSIRRLDKKKGKTGEIVATSGEILSEEESGEFQRDSTTDDTRVKTAISWLEESQIIKRDENEVQIFPSSLRVSTIEEAKSKLSKQNITQEHRKQLLSIVSCIFDADSTAGVSTDELMAVSGMNAEQVRTALFDLERIGIAKNDTALTAYVHARTERSSEKRLKEAVAEESALIDLLRKECPDLSKDESAPLYLQQAAQRMRNEGFERINPDRISRLLNGLSKDGKTESSNEKGSIKVKRNSKDVINVTLLREWTALATTAEIRIAACQCVLSHLLSTIPADRSGVDLLSETTMGDLIHALESDITLKSRVKDFVKLLHTSLLWLHELDIIRLNKGLAIFRPAMTIRIQKPGVRFTKADFQPLELHYREQTIQVHIMSEYAERGLKSMENALSLTFDYFCLKQEDFLKKWLPAKRKEITLETTAESWSRIVDSLNNTDQKKIVTDSRDSTSVLVLAGPGSGKTRTIVHRIAYLVRVRRERPDSIIALAYNRHAAQEIRNRLRSLIASDANGITVLTCHSLAMKLAGFSFREIAEKNDKDVFKQILKKAIALLNGDGLDSDEADEQRERLLSGFRWIFVDEYQDIGVDQYELISALAGRTQSADNKKLTLMCVGDDDQNIYAFDGANVDFIRKFEQEYNASKLYLVENYRSSYQIIDASNRIIELSTERMKTDHPIVINRSRINNTAGGKWASLDVVAKGRVSILHPVSSIQQQAVAAINELLRLSKLDSQWDWSSCAVIARDWKSLEPVRAYCEHLNIPVQLANDHTWSYWRLREIQRLVDWLSVTDNRIISMTEVSSWIQSRAKNIYWNQIAEAVEEFWRSNSEHEIPAALFVDWLAEWARDLRRTQSGLLLLTAHRAKGLEFKHVVVLDGTWDRIGENEDHDAPRRLYYVAMTRAEETLTLARLIGGTRIIEPILTQPCTHLHEKTVMSTIKEVHRFYVRPSLQEIDIGYAGRYPANSPVHASISRVDVNSKLSITLKDNRWYLLDDTGNVVGRMAQSFGVPENRTFVSGSVIAVIVRRRTDSEERYAELSKCDHWEIVVPELVFE